MVSPMKIERVKKEITQIDIWMKTGIPQWKLSLIERGLPPKPEEARKIAEVLSCQPEDIFPSVNECRRGFAN